MLNQLPLILLFIIFAVNLWYVFAIIYHLIRFGNLEIQTSGTENKFNFTNFPDPEKIKEIILS